MDLLNMDTVTSDNGSSSTVNTQFDNLEIALCHVLNQSGSASVQVDVNSRQTTLPEPEPKSTIEDPSIPEDVPLVDFSDEQTIQVPAALLMTAEMDDTFGIFNKQYKPKSYSTPNCLPNRLKHSAKSSSTTSWDSPSFLASINLNDGFLKPSTSDFTVWADNQPPEAENMKDSLENGEKPNTEHQDEVGSTGSEASTGKDSHEPINSDDKAPVSSLDDNSAVISPITQLEGSLEHEDKTSDNDNVFQDSTDSDILDINNLSVFTADESNMSAFILVGNSNVKRMHIDFTETNEEENVEAQIRRTPKTPSPSSVIRTPSGRARNLQRPPARELDSTVTVSTSPLRTASTCPESSVPAIALTSGTEESHTNAPSSSISTTPTTQRSSRALSASAAESPMKHSPFPTLESVLKKVDEMFSNIDYVDPELLKQRKERERLASLPAVLPKPVERKLEPILKTNVSLDSAVNECVNSTYVASTSIPSDIDALNQTNTVNTEVPPELEPEPVTPEPKNHNHDEIGTPFQTPASNKYKPTPSETPLTSNSSHGRSRVIAPIPRLSFSSSSSSGSDSCKRLSLAKPVVIAPKPASKGTVVLSARGVGSEVSASLKINPQKLKPMTLQPMKATMAMPTSTSTVTTAPAPRTRPNVCASAPVTRKFIPPIAASSPKPGIQAPTSARGSIPSPQRRSLSVKSSGYGQQSSLNLSRTSLNSSRTSLNTSIPSAAPSNSTQIPARVSMPSPKAKVSISRTMPSPRGIPAPRAMPSPIRTRISSLQLPGNTNGTAAQRSVSMEDIPDKITEVKTAVSEAAKGLPVSKNKENKPKLLQRFGFRK